MHRTPFDRMRNEFEDLFEQLQQYTPQRAGIPVDVREEDDRVVVTADLPGVEKEQIDVDVTPYRVRIQAADVTAVEHEEKEYYRRERSAHRLQRAVDLPGRVDPDSASATYKNGVMTVTLDRAAEAGRSVDIN